jgi:serine/threonine protein kinase
MSPLIFYRQKNIVIDENGNPKLCDFGLARIQHQVRRGMSLSLEGGSQRHMAPELSVGPEKFRTTTASDIYSFAMTILELDTQQPPFGTYVKTKAAARAAEEGIRPSRPLRMGSRMLHSSDGLWSLLESMWHRNPWDRPSASQVHEFLDQLKRQSTLPLFGSTIVSDLN